jgi:hypothetical protein
MDNELLVFFLFILLGIVAITFITNMNKKHLKAHIRGGVMFNQIGLKVIGFIKFLWSELTIITSSSILRLRLIVTELFGIRFFIIKNV